MTVSSERDSNFAWKSFLAGGIAGCTAKTVVAPLDRVKIHFQVKTPKYEHHIGRFAGVFRAMADTRLKEGFVGLFRGHSATILRVFPYAAINFTAYEKFKVLFGISPTSNTTDGVPAWKRIISGSLAGCTAVTCTYPLDLLRARIAFLASSERNPLKSNLYKSSIQKLWSEGLVRNGSGLLGFYQGYVPTIIGIIPYAGTSFCTFESLKGWHARRFGPDNLPAGIRLLYGMIAGVCAQTVTYPLDVVRRRSQLWRVTHHLPPSDTFRIRDTGLMLVELIRRGGVKELFVGLSINYLKVAPSMGISFVVYDFIKAKL